MDNSEQIREILTGFTAAHRAQLDNELAKSRSYEPTTDVFGPPTITQMWHAYAAYYDRILSDAVIELTLKADALSLYTTEAFATFKLQFESHIEHLRNDILEEYKNTLGLHEFVDDGRMNDTTAMTRDGIMRRLDAEMVPAIAKAKVSALQGAEPPSVLAEFVDPAINADREERFRNLKASNRDHLAQMAAKGQIGYGPGYLAIAEMYEAEIHPTARAVRDAYEKALQASNQNVDDAAVERILSEANTRILIEYERLYDEMVGGTKQHRIAWFPGRFRERMDTPRANAINDLRLLLLQYQAAQKEKAEAASRKPVRDYPYEIGKMLLSALIGGVLVFLFTHQVQRADTLDAARAAKRTVLFRRWLAYRDSTMARTDRLSSTLRLDKYQVPEPHSSRYLLEPECVEAHVAARHAELLFAYDAATSRMVDEYCAAIRSYGERVDMEGGVRALNSSTKNSEERASASLHSALKRVDSLGTRLMAVMATP